MFMFPEPPPLDYYITDISQSYLADGIFYHGRAAAGHKHIAKQLKPIKRTLRDPIAPPQELDSRTLNRMLADERGRYVNPCGKDDGMVYDTFKWMPKWKRGRKERDKSSFSTFPRSQQYELSHIREMRKKLGKCKMTATIHEEKEGKEAKEKKVIKTDEEQCYFLEPPIWWKGETGKPRALPVGNIDDYTFERPADRDHADVKISEKLHMDHPMKYVPGVIHRIKNPEDTSMKDVLERADAFKVALRNVESLPKDSPPVDRCICPPRERLLDSKLARDSLIIHATRCDKDRRWQPVYESTSIFATDAERQKELRKLTRPFSHDLHIWYTRNKPTKARD